MLPAPAEPLECPPRDLAGAGALTDMRFRALLDAAAWAGLPADVKRRFSKRLAGGSCAVYAGHVTGVRLSFLGFCLAQVLRLIGAPLPLSRETGVPAVVAVTEDARCGGQIWTRSYGQSGGFPQVIHSAKRFAGPTGLEEYIGCGVGVALVISAIPSGLAFRSAHYFFGLGRWRIKLPRWLAPGALTVTHEETRAPEFLFTLDLSHPWFGTLIRQEALFSQELS